MSCMKENFAVGTLLNGRYRTISPLNHGSFGMVFTAKDLHSNQTVAIKCLTKTTAAANDSCFNLAIDDKSEELVLHSRLGSHPNIVNLLDSFETDSHTYLVLEFCPRGDLYEAIRIGHGPLETEHVRQFMLELVDAVAFIHAKAVYHRDIKPENIFLSEDGAMKLGDFGLATTEKWTFETTVGSDRYMSPEQYDSAGAGYSPAEADIWAIGICLLNILFSRNPFTIPTEADPLFLDFSRDKQSLFDVFPSMSQDTYEVIVQCMNLDPKRRSLVGAREALLRVVSFTTLDEALDDFCSGNCHAMATSNREPLRTPSIQSPALDQGAFPWVKALRANPSTQIRQLSVIPDDESYTEDLFSKSGATADWSSVSAQTPSLSSVLDSQLAASMKAMSIARPKPMSSRPKVSPMAGSLPITMSRPRNFNSLSIVLGRQKDVVSKSWSDMWDEDIEEEEEEELRARQLQQLNARTWSHESKSAEPVGVIETYGQPSELEVAAKPVDVPVAIHDVDGDLADGFFFQDDIPAPKPQPITPARYSPPPKREGGMDKWAALGERRRAVTGTPLGVRSLDWSKPRRTLDLTVTAYAPGPLDASSFQQKWNKDRYRDRPWNRGRDWNIRRKDKRPELGDIEWVGGWQEAHA